MAPKLSQKQRVPLAAREVQIIRRLKHIVKLPVTKIALATGRNKSTIYQALDAKWQAAKRGPKDKLTTKDVNLLVRTAKTMIQKAKARKEITLAMITRRAKMKASERCVRKYLQKMMSKPMLTKADIKKRFVHLRPEVQRQKQSFLA